MSSSVTTTSGGLVVVTQWFPSNQPQPQGVQQTGLRTQRFIRAYPLAVGTVQIMIGIFVLLSGFFTFSRPTPGINSGLFVWGAGFYITSGSLTVAAGKSLRRSLINTALGFNVVSSVAASAAIILYSLDAGHVRISGFSGVPLVFHILEFVVSLTVSVFACRSTCNCCDDQQQPYVHYTPVNAPTPAQTPPQPVPATMAVPPQQISSFPKPAENQDQDQPPAYMG